jgi:alpha-1,4-galacturonosyltransferase
MNVFDLVEWKRQKITEVYHNWQNLVSDSHLFAFVASILYV